jgi:FtsZ-binding cell division protein ZapB
MTIKKWDIFEEKVKKMIDLAKELKSENRELREQNSQLQSKVGEVREALDRISQSENDKVKQLELDLRLMRDENDRLKREEKAASKKIDDIISEIESLISEEEASQA